MTQNLCDQDKYGFIYVYNYWKINTKTDGQIKGQIRSINSAYSYLLITAKYRPLSLSSGSITDKLMNIKRSMQNSMTSQPQLILVKK